MLRVGGGIRRCRERNRLTHPVRFRYIGNPTPTSRELCCSASGWFSKHEPREGPSRTLSGPTEISAGGVGQKQEVNGGGGVGRRESRSDARDHASELRLCEGSKTERLGELPQGESDVVDGIHLGIKMVEEGAALRI